MEGFPDYNDFCLTVSNTIPITFLCPITISVDETCDKDVGEFTYSFMIDGGLPAVDNTQTYDVTGDWYNGTGISAGEMVTVGPIADLTSYTVTASDANGCESSVTSLVECEKVPIELLEFRGIATDDGNLISWRTASEINNDYFTLESSIDGINFLSLSIIEGAGTSSDINDYSYLDEVYKRNIIYYRLKQTDYDGTYSYSDIIQVFNNSNGQDTYEIISLVHYDSSIEIQLSFSNSNIQLIDMNGAIISNVSVSGNQHSIETGNSPNGIYYLHVYSDYCSLMKKIIIDN